MASLEHAIDALNIGQVIAYPTEAVWGLGCDPFSESAVKQILQLKNRPAEKGMILLINDWDQLESLVCSKNEINWQPIKESWPGAVTWVFPASDLVPAYLQVNNNIALRMPSYPFLQELLKSFAKPLVSTSANVSGMHSAKTERAVATLFPSVVTYSGECEGLSSPSTIFDAITGECLRG